MERGSNVVNYPLLLELGSLESGRAGL